MYSPDIIFIGIIPDFTLRVEISRRSIVNEVACSADVNDFAFCCTGFLACDDGGYGLGGEGVACIHCDVMFCTGSFDLFEIGEVAGYDTVDVKGRFKSGIGASDVGGYFPVWMGLLESSSIGN